MKLIDCFKSINLSNGITKEELEKYECLKKPIYYLDNDVTYLHSEELILILFKAVQELKNEIDSLKGN
jgi:hypothetical protein